MYETYWVGNYSTKYNYVKYERKIAYRKFLVEAIQRANNCMTK